MLIKTKAFTLIEIIIWILIVSIVIVSWFDAYVKVWIWKIKLIEETEIQKDSFFFSEKFFQLVKNWWTIDYEEYFNRKVVWNTTFWSGHYDEDTWFWNFWEWWSVWNSTYWTGFYLCRSWDWVLNKMTWSWCYDNDTLNNTWIDYTWSPQRYGQYSYQFIDYNSNHDADWLLEWDENWDWNIVWDDDDEYLWLWPEVFTWGIDVKELYLISWDKKTRTLFRWNVDKDSSAPVTQFCNAIWDDWCRWTIEFLVLEGKDWWLDHDGDTSTNPDWTQNDWVIDTWLIGGKFSWETNLDSTNSVVAGSDSINYRKPLFDDNINVTDFQVYLYPNIDSYYSWKSVQSSHNISPYVTLHFKIKPSWETRKKLRNTWRELNFNTTINLTEIFSK